MRMARFLIVLLAVLSTLVTGGCDLLKKETAKTVVKVTIGMPYTMMANGSWDVSPLPARVVATLTNGSKMVQAEIQGSSDMSVTFPLVGAGTWAISATGYNAENTVVSRVTGTPTVIVGANDAHKDASVYLSRTGYGLVKFHIDITLLDAAYGSGVFHIGSVQKMNGQDPHAEGQQILLAANLLGGGSNGTMLESEVWVEARLGDYRCWYTYSADNPTASWYSDWVTMSITEHEFTSFEWQCPAQGVASPPS